MQPTTTISLAILRSAHPLWPSLCAALATYPDIRIVGESTQADQGSMLAAEHPAVLLLAADLADCSSVAIVSDLKTLNPSIKIIVLGPVAGLDGYTLLALHDQQIRGYLAWEDIEPETVYRVIGTTLHTGVLVTSPTVLKIFRETLELRQRPRVDGLVLSECERASSVSPPCKMTELRVHATIWTDNPDVRVSLSLLLGHVGIAVAVVDTAEAFLAAAARSAPRDFVIIDCATVADAVDRCLHVVPYISVPIHICHPQHEFVDDLKPLARSALYWLPPAWTGMPLFERVRTLTAHPTPTSTTMDALLIRLSPREREVAQLLANHETDEQIAADLHVSPSTAKSMVRAIKNKLDVDNRAELRAACAHLLPLARP